MLTNVNYCLHLLRRICAQKTGMNRRLYLKNRFRETSHMILLQFFAKNEEWMIGNGMLVNEKLKVYVSFKVVSIREIFNRITCC